MDLSKRILESISLGIKNALNEAGRINHRTIDRKLWLSVASVCSRNRSTEAEFVRPMKKLTKDDLLNRYVAALLIMKKPCPKSETDIEKNKTLKLFAQKALQLGATFEDIQNLYNVNKGKMGSTVAGSTLSQEIVLQTVREPLKDMESLSNKDLQGKYLYRYYTSYGFGYGSTGFSVGVRDLDDGERRFVLGTYLMSNDKFDIFVSEYQELITKSGRSRWDTEVAGKKTLGKPGMNLKYVPKMYETQDDALEDYNGMENTAVCTLFSGGVFPFMYTFNKVVHRSSGWEDSYLKTESGYIPSLGELMYAFKYSNLLKDVKGLVWSSTFKDPTHVYATDGKSIQVLDLEKDSAYLVPFIPVKKGETKFRYELEQEYFPGVLGLNKDDFIKQDKGNYLQLAKAWKLNINQSEYEAIEKRAKLLSNRELESKIIELLKKGVGNSNRRDEKGFYKKEMYNNHWNMLIDGLVYSNNKLFVKYWTGGDSTDSSDWINVDKLIGTHTDTTAKTRFSFDVTAKNEILMTAYTLLMYWDKLIKKYS